jgi:peptidoglycan/xylan/chitin deacetylase (PgdA/CDA1 family)
MKKQGVFVISLDFELYWGMRDKRSLSNYSANLDGVEKAIKGILDLFKVFNIHATWATVGFVFFRDHGQLTQNVPRILPDYTDSLRNPYKYITNSGRLDPRYHFAPHLIDLILNCDGQEIGTHTYSHYYCLEPGQDAESFREDIEAAMNIARQRNLTIKSLVFPRNQWNPDYLSILKDLGITGYRGVESGFMYAAVEQERQSKTMRAARLLDSYINLSGHHTYELTEIATTHPYNIASSRFLRPHSRKLRFLESFRLKRITAAMSYAARNGRLFHLWWHPHNFGVNTDRNLAFLEKILLHFKCMNQYLGMRTLNMGDVSDLLDASDEL